MAHAARRDHDAARALSKDRSLALYPLTAPRISCRSVKIERIQKAAALYRVGQRIVAYINQQMEEGSDERRTFIYGAVANKLKVEPKDVERILQELGGGGTGIIVVKRDPPRSA